MGVRIQLGRQEVQRKKYLNWVAAITFFGDLMASLSIIFVNRKCIERTEVRSLNVKKINI